MISLKKDDTVIIVEDIRMIMGGPLQDIVGALTGHMGRITHIWEFDYKPSLYDVKVGKSLFTYRAQYLRKATPLDFLARA